MVRVARDHSFSPTCGSLWPDYCCLFILLLVALWLLVVVVTMTYNVAVSVHVSKDFLFYVYEFCLNVCVWTTCMQYPHGGQKVALDPLDICEQQYECWEQNPGPL